MKVVFTAALFFCIIPFVSAMANQHHSTSLVQHSNFKVSLSGDLTITSKDTINPKIYKRKTILMEETQPQRVSSGYITPSNRHNETSNRYSADNPQVPRKVQPRQPRRNSIYDIFDPSGIKQKGAKSLSASVPEK